MILTTRSYLSMTQILILVVLGCSDSGSDLDASATPDSGETSADSGSTDAGTADMGVEMDGGQPGQCTPTEVVISHASRGAFNSPAVVMLGQPWKVVSGSFQIRNFGTGTDSAPVTRNYHTFELSTVTATIARAELRIVHPSNTFEGNADTVEVATLFAVETDPGILDDPSAFSDAGDFSTLTRIFGDLGTGSIYGTFSVTASSADAVQAIPLSPTAVADLNWAAGAGRAWSVGGALSSAGGEGPIERVLRGSGDITPDTQLVLQVVSCRPILSSITAADLGYYRVALPVGSTEPAQSVHWQSPQGEHQSLFTGNQNTSLGGVNFNDERRAYLAFDLSGIQGQVTGAALRIWVWQAATANAGNGSITTEDATETMGLFSVDSFSASAIIEARFNDTSEHGVDVPIWEDLGSGSEFGSRIYTTADELFDLVPSPSTTPTTVCGSTDSACGKWVEIQLNQNALDAINAENGLWAVGAALTSIGPNVGAREWINVGFLADLDSAKPFFPDFLSPAPELLILSIDRF